MINIQAISLATCILGAAWVRTVRGDVTNYILDIGKLEFFTSVCAVCIGMRHLSASLAMGRRCRRSQHRCNTSKKQNVNIFCLFLLILQEVYILVLMLHTYVLILVL